jgi:2-C-methyl-D-erythritol 2,4-cyclodiphosphate synthase
MIKQRKMVVVNADITLIAEAPRVAKYVDAMSRSIAEDLETEVGRVNVKATTTEKMGYVGREEGIAAQAVILLESL